MYYRTPPDCWADFRIGIRGRWRSMAPSHPQTQPHPNRCPDLAPEPCLQTGPITGLIFSKNHRGHDLNHPTQGRGGSDMLCGYIRERTPPTAPSEVRSCSRSNDKSVSKRSIWVERRNFYGAVPLPSREPDFIRESSLLRPQGGGVMEASCRVGPQRHSPSLFSTRLISKLPIQLNSSSHNDLVRSLSRHLLTHGNDGQ